MIAGTQPFGDSSEVMGSADRGSQPGVRGIPFRQVFLKSFLTVLGGEDSQASSCKTLVCLVALCAAPKLPGGESSVSKARAAL